MPKLFLSFISLSFKAEKSLMLYPKSIDKSRLMGPKDVCLGPTRYDPRGLFEGLCRDDPRDLRDAIMWTRVFPAIARACVDGVIAHRDAIVDPVSVAPCLVVDTSVARDSRGAVT